MLAEARQAMLLARLAGARRSPHAGCALMTPRDRLEIATRVGAAILGRTDIGSLAPGMCADFFALNFDTIAYAGARHDAVAAVVMCEPQRAACKVVNGRFLVRGGQLQSVDLGPILERHTRLSLQLANTGGTGQAPC